MRTIRSILFLALALIAAPVSAQVTPQTLAKLEARKQANPNDARALRDLGIALFKLKRYTDAHAVLADASKINPRDGVTALYLGMSAEEMNDLTAARQSYTTYLATGKTKAAKDAVNQRLALLQQRELKAQAAAAVVREQSLGGQPSPRTIAVLPLSVTGAAGTQYEPLGRGLAELMIADFAKVGDAITILERERVQTLLDEIALGRSNQIDRATAVRSGRLLQAGRIVTGSLVVPSAQNAQINTTIVSLATPNAAQTGGAAVGGLNGIFDQEKEVVLETLDSLKIPVSSQVRAEIRGNRPTTNLQAFLAYSRGLTSSDAGRLDEAASFFDNAHALDPNFSAAAAQASNARSASAGQSVTTTRIEATLRGTSEGQVVNAAENGASSNAGTLSNLSNTLQNVLADVNPSTADAMGRGNQPAARDPQSSSTATDGSAATRTGTITIIIKRP